MAQVFLTLLVKIIPLYVNLALGFFAGKWLGVDRTSIANLMIYVISPVVFFGGISKMELTPALLAVPFIGYVLSLCIALPMYVLMHKLYDDSRPGIMALAAGTGNNGYFGLPIAMLLFDTQAIGIYLMLVIGITLFESSVGFFLTARGHHTAKESFVKTIRLPTLYSLVLGVVVSFAGWDMPAPAQDFFRYFEGAYAVLGMMMIGLGLSGMKRLEVDASFCGMLFFARFIAWPALGLSLVWADANWFGLYGEAVHKAVTLICIMPLAANSVAIASILRTCPEKTATAVLLSTIFAIVYVPFMVSYLF